MENVQQEGVLQQTLCLLRWSASYNGKRKIVSTKRLSQRQRSRSMRLPGLRGESRTINQLLARWRRARP